MVHLNQRLLEAVGNGGIVDILRGQSEVDELFVGMQAEFIHLLFEQILDGFDIMVGCPFDLFDPQGISFGKMAVNIAQGLPSGFVHPFELRQRQFTQRDEILHLHQYPVANQSIF